MTTAETHANAPGPGEEAPRLLAVPSSEELLFVFSSGRIATLAVTEIASGEVLDWNRAEAPQEPRGGETLACVAPISRLAMAEMIVQASRRGFVKKLMTSLASSVMNKHYIGTGATIQGDRTHTRPTSSPHSAAADDGSILTSTSSMGRGRQARIFMPVKPFSFRRTANLACSS